MIEQNHDERSSGSSSDSLHRKSAAQFQDAVGVLASAMCRLMEHDANVRQAVQVVAQSIQSGETNGDSSAPHSSLQQRRGNVGLDTIAQRSSIKSQACLARAQHAADYRQHTQELTSEARSLRCCWLWMLQPESDSVAQEDIRRLGDIYRNLSLAASFVQGIALREEQSIEKTASAYRLLAEAQSALWVALTDIGQARDQDQIDSFIWLRERTRDERVYLDRFMRREDPADPAAWSLLRDRIERASASETVEAPEVTVRSAIAVTPH